MLDVETQSELCEVERERNWTEKFTITIITYIHILVWKRYYQFQFLILHKLEVLFSFSFYRGIMLPKITYLCWNYCEEMLLRIFPQIGFLTIIFFCSYRWLIGFACANYFDCVWIYVLFEKNPDHLHFVYQFNTKEVSRIFKIRYK